MTVLWGADVFVLGLMGTTAGKFSLRYDSSVRGADIFVLGIMGAPAGKCSLWYDSSRCS